MLPAAAARRERAVTDSDVNAGTYCREHIPLLIGWRIIAKSVTDTDYYSEVGIAHASR